MASHLRNWELGTTYVPGVSKVLGPTSGSTFLANANSPLVALSDTNPDSTSGKDSAHWHNISILDAGVPVERQTLFLYDSEANFDIDWPYDSNDAAATDRYIGMPVIFTGATAAATPEVKVWDGGAFIDATHDVYEQSDTVIYTNMEESLTADPFDAAVFGAIEFLVAQGKQGKQVKKIRSTENLNYALEFNEFEDPAPLPGAIRLHKGLSYKLNTDAAKGSAVDPSVVPDSVANNGGTVTSDWIKISSDELVAQGTDAERQAYNGPAIMWYVNDPGAEQWWDVIDDTWTQRVVV